MRLFKKKKKDIVVKQKMNFDDVHMLLNIKTICHYEFMTGKHFFSNDMNEEDMIHLLYSMLVVNNPAYDISYSVFKIMLEDERVLAWALREGKNVKKKMENMFGQKSKNNTEETDKQTDISVTDIATYLVVQHHMDINYVMFKMDLWEISAYISAANKDSQFKLENDRLWTYLTILPQIDGKKMKSPQQLIKFSWEEKDDKKEELEKNTAAAMSFLGGNMTGDKEEE